MKYLKRSILTLAIAVIPFHSYVNGCGGDYYDYMNYYNLFDQLLLENKGLQPFLLTTDYAFYGEDTNPDAEQQPDENLNAWMTFFKKNNTLQEMDTAQFKTLLYSASYQSLKQPSSPYVIALRKADPHLPTICKGTGTLRATIRKRWLVGHETCRLPFGRDVRPLQKQRAGTLPALPIS